ncbi:hypothetical protein NBO_64g0041 [Nosema bombycis CQ1]|uniref:Uncharacterized protein n=1 Tax=Nosema bombycis (strain CQ1 / CVCC 102059) TaxID=578461 RepID=R0MHN5_NOSB1|nr:hypothetical protein NBO_64g0041 [Nosema bombycis CQ1]|eukprot:EOB13660.1 hypothetical protein NBO_64g0041 [Nosema bombycis CQ1]
MMKSGTSESPKDVTKSKSSCILRVSKMALLFGSGTFSGLILRLLCRKVVGQVFPYEPIAK